MVELKAQIVECQSELDQMREDKALIVDQQVQRRAEYKGKVADERKRIAFLTKEINAMETEMVNTTGYRRIFDLENERKNVQKALQTQLTDNEAQQNVYARHSNVLNQRKNKIADVQSKEQNYKNQQCVITREIKQTTKDVYEWEKQAVATGRQVETIKSRNNELMRAIQMVKKDPKLLEKVANQA